MVANPCNVTAAAEGFGSWSGTPFMQGLEPREGLSNSQIEGYLAYPPQYLHFKIVKDRLFWGLFLPYYSSLCTKHKTLKISIAFTPLQRKIIFQTSICWAPALHFPGCKSSITKMNSKTNPKIMSKKVVVIIRSKSPSFCVIVRG